MDLLRLPSLPNTAPLDAAWEVMVSAERCALVTLHEGQGHLVAAGELIRAQNRGAEVLRDVEGTRIALFFASLAPALDLGRLLELSGVAIAASTPLGAAHARFNADSRHEDMANEVLHGVELGIVAVLPGEAVLVTARESYGDPYAGAPKKCYCDNPSHRHPHDQGSTGDPCRTGDGYNLDCKR